MRLKGIIVTWNDEKGFGFVKPSRGNRDLFVHISDFNRNAPRPSEGASVSFEISKDTRGRPCATAIRITGLPGFHWKRFLPVVFSTFFTAVFLGAVFYASTIGRIPYALLMAYLALGVITFFVYALDKSAARKGHWRMPESTLHILSLLGGWPAALVARHLLRHKTRKQPFVAVFWITVLLNGGLLVGLLTPDGQVLVQNFLEPFLAWPGEDFLEIFRPFRTWLKYDVLR